jgi:mycofactocin glycosyltransferase
MAVNRGAVRPFPPDLPIALDHSVRRHGQTLLGGSPKRAVRLSDAGMSAVDAMQREGAGPSDGARALARRLVEGGLAHPRPRFVRAAENAVTIVIPVRDRRPQLDRCLAALDGPAIVVDDGSSDPDAIAATCAEHGAALIRRDRSGGPAAARNAGIARLSTEFIAFLDSDCIPPPGWINRLIGHFADPLVAAVAPRIRPARGAATGWLSRFEEQRLPIDPGPHPSDVAPGKLVGYVSTSALLVRRDAIGDGFDEELRQGEDVDFVWRLRDAGWRVRYDPAVVVEHEEPATWRGLMTRRFRYGTAAAKLSVRHRGRVAHAVLPPRPTAVLVCLAAGRLRAAAVVQAADVVIIARRMSAAHVPPGQAVAHSLSRTQETFFGVGRSLTMLVPLALLAAARRGDGARLLALALALGTPLREWRETPRHLDPLRWSALCLADDVVYGAGVWAGCVRRRTFVPVLPIRRFPDP